MSDEVDIEILESGEEIEEPIAGILNEEDLEVLAKYLKEEYDAADTEMSARNQKALKWRQNMEAVANDAPKNHPYKNSSNIMVPVTQVIAQALSAKVLGTFDAREPLWDVQSLRHEEDAVRRMKTVSKVMNVWARSPTDLNMEQVLQDLVAETVLVGGAFPKVPWVIDRWRVKDANGGETIMTAHDGPLVTIVPVERVKYRRGVGVISRLPWIGVDTPLTKIELEKRASDGIYDVEGVQKILNQPRTTPTDSEEQAQRAEMFDSGETTGLYDITEFYVYWDIDGTGVPVDLLVTMHVQTETVLQVQYNVLGMRMLAASKYVHRPNTITGRGVGQMTESMQDEVTTVHNASIDNMKLANTRMLAVKRSGPLGAKEEIYPGKILYVENPAEDIRPIQLGEIYPSAHAAESGGWAIAQRAVGLSDTMMGFADQTMKSRDTVRGQAMRIQQGDSVLGGAVAGLRNVLGQIGMMVWIQNVANKERVMARERAAKRFTEEELKDLEEALDMTVAEVPTRMAFTVKVTDAERTFEQQRMNVMTLTQMLTQFGQQTIPLAMQVYGPQGEQMKQQAPELYNYMGRILAGSAKMMEDIFRFFNIYNTKDYLPDSERIDQMMDMFAAALQGFQAGSQMQVPSAQEVPAEIMQEGAPEAGATGMPMGNGGMM